MTVIIPRRELDSVLKGFRWLLLYGRRKTGKTFYVRERADYDRYFVVARNRALIDLCSGESYSQDEFRKMLPLMLRGERVVVDEFHRLDEPVLSTIQALSGTGNLLLITSTMHYFREVVGRGSPLLGLFELRQVSLVDPRDAIEFASSLGLKGREMLEAACIVQEPWLAPVVERYREKAPFRLREALRVYAPHLVGEVFAEEDVQLTARYSAILGAIADGKTQSSEISSRLYSRGLIEKDNPGLVSQYLKNLVEMGLVKATPLEGKRKRVFRYRHASPILDLAHYLDEKYGFFEADMDEQKVGEAFSERVPTYMEWFFEELLSRMFGMQPVKISTPELEVDIALREHAKIKVVAEVKWRRNVDSKELSKVEEKLMRFGEARKILIVPSGDTLEKTPENIEVWDWKKLTAEAHPSGTPPSSREQQ